MIILPCEQKLRFRTPRLNFPTQAVIILANCLSYNEENEHNPTEIEEVLSNIKMFYPCVEVIFVTLLIIFHLYVVNFFVCDISPTLYNIENK